MKVTRKSPIMTLNTLIPQYAMYPSDYQLNKRNPRDIAGCSLLNRCNNYIELDQFSKYIGKFKYLRTMQMNPKDEAKKEDQDAATEEEEQDHEYNCQCNKCSDKYGNLPLLVRVIEQHEKGASGSSVEDINQPSSSTAANSRSKTELCCSVCDKKFSHKGDFNKHLRKHTGEQPYKCDVCNKKFAHTSNLSRHLKLHSGIKPFECNVCQKRFSRKDKLISHQKSRSCRRKSD